MDLKTSSVSYQNSTSVIFILNLFFRNGANGHEEASPILNGGGDTESAKKKKKKKKNKEAVEAE